MLRILTGSLSRRIRSNHMSSIASSPAFCALSASPTTPKSSAAKALERNSMDQLEVLPSISRLSDHVVRVLGQNPGKFTLQGTNTYLIGASNPYTLIDTAEGLSAYIPILESALRTTAPPSDPSLPDVSDIVISHWHPDHVGGLPSVLELLRRLWDERNFEEGQNYTPPRLHKFPFSPTGPHTTHGAPNLLPSILSSLSANSYTPSPSGDAFHDLHDDQVLSSQVRILHTPGHTTDSISLYIPQDKALYTADTVLGQGTAVFEDLSLYLASLRKMLEFSDGDGYTILYPGHGPIVKNGKEIITGYIHHRLDREAQILKVLQRPPPAPTSPSGSEDVGAVTGTDAALAGESTYWSTWTIVTTMYAAYPESLWLPAAHGVDLHLKKLEQDGVVRRVKAGGEGQRQHTTWELAGALPTELEPVPVDRLGKY